MKLEAAVTKLREDAIRDGREPVPRALQGVTRERIKAVLRRIDRATNDQVDVVFALLDDTRPSWFRAVAATKKFADGASTSHLGCHVGILQRGGTKRDREGRDYWIKPLRQLGAIEAVTLVDGEFRPGHVRAKSPWSAYRLSDDFRSVLQAPNSDEDSYLFDWIQADAVRIRLELQAQLAAGSRAVVHSAHSALIGAAVEYYVPHFLRGYEVIYIDDGDGDRITTAQRAMLGKAGISIQLQDAMPDVLLWNPNEDALWVIEAVTSDGEVDLHKATQLRLLAERAGKRAIHFTTAFKSWKVVAARQGRYKNIAPGTYIWIQEDPSKQLLVESF